LARQNAIRFLQEKTAEIELKRQPIRTNADLLWNRLMFGKVPQALDLTIQKLSRTGHPDSRQRMVDAFVTVLCDLHPGCEAAVAALGIAEEVGMPLDKDRGRKIALNWLRQPPSTRPSRFSGELCKFGWHVCVASASQPGTRTATTAMTGTHFHKGSTTT
jgi:hypothetical protein